MIISLQMLSSVSEKILVIMTMLFEITAVHKFFLHKRSSQKGLLTKEDNSNCSLPFVKKTGNSQKLYSLFIINKEHNFCEFPVLFVEF